MSIVVALTGHRSEDCEYEPTVRRKFRNVIEDVPEIGTVICGMANGFDLWAGEEALGLGLELWAYRPWAGHKARRGDEALYARVLEGASRVVNVDESLTYRGPWQYHNRNHRMVDDSDRVLAYWNGKEEGGTYECLQYALHKAVPKRKYRNVYLAF